MPAASDQPAIVPDRICLSDDQRSLRLAFGPTSAPATSRSASAVIDIGEGGRLLGIDVAAASGQAPLLVDVDPPLGDLSRSVAVTLTLERRPSGSISAIELPRRGTGYEISYPSGNQ